MNAGQPFYAVLLFPQAVEALGGAIAKHIRDGAYGPHMVCRRIGSSGPFFEIVFEGTDGDDRPVDIEVMIPHGFVRMVLSVRGEGVFGFQQHWTRDAAGGAG